MTRLEQRLRMLGLSVLLLIVALVLVVSDHRGQRELNPGPLQVASLWWSPEAASHGVHALHGKVLNTTDTTWENVQVSLDFRNAHGESLFVRTVPIGRVAPGAATEFTTGPVPARSEHVALLGITGLQRSLQPALGTERTRTLRRSRRRARCGGRRTRGRTHAEPGPR